MQSVECGVFGAKQNEDGHIQSAASATKNAGRLLETSQKYCACHKPVTQAIFNTFSNTGKCHEVPRLPRKTTLVLV